MFYSSGSDQTRKILVQVPPKYQRKESTPFTATVKAQPNTLDPFPLEGPPLNRKR